MLITKRTHKIITITTIYIGMKNHMIKTTFYKPYEINIINDI